MLTPGVLQTLVSRCPNDQVLKTSQFLLVGLLNEGTNVSYLLLLQLLVLENALSHCC